MWTTKGPRKSQKGDKEMPRQNNKLFQVIYISPPRAYSSDVFKDSKILLRF